MPHFHRASMASMASKQAANCVPLCQNIVRVSLDTTTSIVVKTISANG
jgi:hypothetical protein